MTKMTLDKLPRNVLAKIDLQEAFMISRCVVAAERFQLFRKLHGKQLTAEAIAKKTGIHKNYLTQFLAAMVSIGLLKRKGRLFSNSALAEKYYIKQRSIYWSTLYSQECIKEFVAFTVLEEMFKSGKSYEEILGIKRTDYIEIMRTNPKWASDFTNMLYHFHQPDAKALAQNLDLKNHEKVLDVAGGSGVMSLALAREYPHIKACVLDIENVVKAAKKIIRREGLSKRVDARVGDMRKDLPKGFDVIMFCDSANPNAKLLKMVYKKLPRGGIVVFVDKFSNEDFTDPLDRLMWQMRSKKFWLMTKNQAVNILRENGFKAVKKKEILKNIWLITGRK
jgi:tRNA A58 N-methylase Trm61